MRTLDRSMNRLCECSESYAIFEKGLVIRVPAYSIKSPRWSRAKLRPPLGHSIAYPPGQESLAYPIDSAVCL